MLNLSPPKRCKSLITVLLLVLFPLAAVASQQPTPPGTGTITVPQPDFIANPNTIRAGKTRNVSLMRRDGQSLPDGVRVDEQSLDEGITIVKQDQQIGGNRALVVTISVDADTEAGVRTLRLMQNDQLLGAVELNVDEFRPTPVRRGPIPVPSPRVDATWGVLSYQTVRDNFGRRVADNYYGIRVTIGNNSGFSLQIVTVAFDSNFGTNNRDEQNQLKTYRVPTVNEQLVRGSIEREQSYGPRALAVNLMSGFGTLAAGFLPFFHAPIPRANYGSFSSLLNGQFREGFALAAPDLTVHQLSSLQNRAMQDTTIIPNNESREIVVFLPRMRLGLTDEQMRDVMAVQDRLGNLVLVGNVVEFAEREIVATRPEGATAEPATSPFGGTRTGSDATPGGGALAANAAPTISKVEPNVGFTTGGTQVIITGTGFSQGSTVMFGDISSLAAEVLSNTSIRAFTPQHPAGSVSITVTSRGVQSAPLLNGFTYVSALSVIGLSSPTGTASGGTTLTISGTGFVPGATVKFGGVDATNVTVVSGNAITVTTPARIAGAGVVDVTVTNPAPNGQTATLASAFTYTATP